MNIVTDKSPGAYAVMVQCLKCYTMLRLADALIDTDGPAFKAYYHPDCLHPKHSEDCQTCNDTMYKHLTKGGK